MNLSFIDDTAINLWKAIIEWDKEAIVAEHEKELDTVLFETPAQPSPPVYIAVQLSLGFVSEAMLMQMSKEMVSVARGYIKSMQYPFYAPSKLKLEPTHQHSFGESVRFVLKYEQLPLVKKAVLMDSEKSHLYSLTSTDGSSVGLTFDEVKSVLEPTYIEPTYTYTLGTDTSSTWFKYTTAADSVTYFDVVNDLESYVDTQSWKELYGVNWPEAPVPNIKTDAEVLDTLIALNV